MLYQLLMAFILLVVIGTYTANLTSFVTMNAGTSSLLVASVAALMPPPGLVTTPVTSLPLVCTYKVS